MGMKWSDLAGVVGKLAPMVGTAVGGPAGTLVGSLVSKALGVENTPEAVSQAIKDDPDAALKLRQMELENEESIREIAFRTLEAELKDVQDAREAHKHHPMPAYITASTTLIMVGIMVGLFVVDIPDANRELANMVFGTALSLWSASVAYWIGTTRSSAMKSFGPGIK